MPLYPELLKLMASNRPKPLTRTKLAKIINKSVGSVSEKLNGKTDFKCREIQAITKYFIETRPELNLTSDIIFSDVEVLTKVNKSQSA